MSLIIGIDPGNIDSAYAVLDNDLRPIDFGKINNFKLLMKIQSRQFRNADVFAIEMIASYGMPVGATVFDTCVWIGRFIESIETYEIKTANLVYRKDEKMVLCGTTKAKDGNVRQALIDRFGPVGVKKNPGWFYGVSKDVWAAIAVGVTYSDMYIKPNETKKKKVEA